MKNPLSDWSFGMCIALLCTSSLAAVELPRLELPTFDSVNAARSNCQGTFRMWGESSKSVQFGNTTANYGPYMCLTSRPQFGYVCEEYQCPEMHISYTFDRDLNFGNPFQNIDPDLPRCPPLESVVGDPLTCIDIQRYCEESGFGWLTEAESHDGGYGQYSCASCSDGEVDGSLTASDYVNPYGTPALIFLYVFTSSLFVISVAVDYVCLQRSSYNMEEKIEMAEMSLAELRQQKKQFTVQFWNNAVLQFLGVTDEDGCPRTFRQQICKNYACSCGSHYERTEFACAIFLSIGLVIVTGGLTEDSISHAQSCSFSGEAPEDPEIDYTFADASIEDAYEYQFIIHHFVGHGSHGGLLTVFSQGFLIPEALCLLYLNSIGTIAKSLKRTGWARFGLAVRILSLLACAAFGLTLLAMYRDALDYNAFMTLWVLGLLVMLFYLGPLCGAFAWGSGRSLELLGALKCPKRQGDEEMTVRRRRTQGAIGLFVVCFFLAGMIVSVATNSGEELGTATPKWT